MKKLLLFIFLGILTSAFIAGCKKDQAKVNEKAISKLLPGKWYSTDVITGDITDGKVSEHGTSNYRGSGQYILFDNKGQGVQDESEKNIFATPFSYSLKDTVLTVNFVAATAPDGVNFPAYTRVFFVHTIDDFNLVLNIRSEQKLANGKPYTSYIIAKFQK